MRIYLLSVFLLFLTACGGAESSIDSTTPLSEGPKARYEKLLKAASSKIKDTKEFDSCMLPSVNSCMTQVGNELARKQNSTEFCNELPDVIGQNACKYGVVLPQVIESGDLKLCDTLPVEYRDNCGSAYVLHKAQKSGLPKDCNDLIKMGQDAQSRLNQCYMLAISTNRTSTVEDCEAIPGEEERNNCANIIRSRK